jgi:ribosomal protein S18 acetylase RimI-like enzyme
VASPTIRRALIDDLPYIRKLFDASVYEGQTRINDTGADIENFNEAYIEGPETSAFWIADATGDVVGMIGVQEIRDDVAEVRRLRVEEGHRRLGVGTSLMEHAIGFCRDHGYVKVVLDVRIERGPAIELFKKFGFFHSRTRESEGHKLLEFYVDLYNQHHA